MVRCLQMRRSKVSGVGGSTVCHRACLIIENQEHASHNLHCVRVCRTVIVWILKFEASGSFLTLRVHPHWELFVDKLNVTPDQMLPKVEDRAWNFTSTKQENLDGRANVK